MKRVIIISILMLAAGFSQNSYINKNDQVRLAPRMLNYQGFLTDTLGNPITNPSVSMTFTIYDAISSGNQKWTETQSSISVDKGIFNVLPGSVTPIPDSVFINSVNRWLELSVAGQTLAPRTRIVSAPFAYTAIYSDTAIYSRNSAPDNDWAFLVSDVADTTLRMGGRWGFARLGNSLYGNADSTHVNFGVACFTGRIGYNYKYCTVAGGRSNTAGYNYATVAGGYANTAFGQYSTVAGGYADTASGQYATVGGGQDNIASQIYATVAGGDSNTASGSGATVAGGGSNTASLNYATIGGGQDNTASQTYSTVAGGNYNTVSGQFSFVGGGYGNTASGNYATVGGGIQNTASGDLATVAGGFYHLVPGIHATVGGGYWNYVNGRDATVGGGYHNYNAGDYSVIVGGYADTITAAGGYSYLFGINSNLTQDSTFLVDLPHVWFGTEANGYEFPYGRGSGGQFMKTNGSGLLSWDSITYMDSARVAANAHKLQNKDTTDLNNSYVNEGQANSIDSLMLQNNAVTMSKISQAGATTGQVIKWNGTAWLPDADSSRDNDWSFLISDAADTTLQMNGRWGLARAGNVMHGNADSTHVNFGVACTTGTTGQNYRYSTVGGGYGNTAGNLLSTVSGGANNLASGNYATVGGGIRNKATGGGGTIGGGNDNTASSSGATVGGGGSNTASSNYATVAGGNYNVASSMNATVAGGYGNVASAVLATVAGGFRDTSAAPYGFTVGDNSTVLSGHDNSAAFNGQTSTASGETRVGVLSKASGTFTIDHPLDPENKILNHYFVESPEMILIYRGTTVLDGQGRGSVQLPDYFDALNEEPIVYLTGIGTSDVYVVENVKNNTFVIGGKAGTRVNWMITGTRKDPSAEITKIIMPVEQVKEGGLVGRSLDDEFLVTTMAQLERMGQSAGFKFRHASEQKRYEEMKKMIESSK